MFKVTYFGFFAVLFSLAAFGSHIGLAIVGCKLANKISILSEAAMFGIPIAAGFTCSLALPVILAYVPAIILHYIIPFVLPSMMALFTVFLWLFLPLNTVFKIIITCLNLGIFLVTVVPQFILCVRRTNYGKQGKFFSERMGEQWIYPGSFFLSIVILLAMLIGSSAFLNSESSASQKTMGVALRIIGTGLSAALLVFGKASHVDAKVKHCLKEYELSDNHVILKKTIGPMLVTGTIVGLLRIFDTLGALDILPISPLSVSLCLLALMHVPTIDVSFPFIPEGGWLSPPFGWSSYSFFSLYSSMFVNSMALSSLICTYFIAIYGYEMDPLSGTFTDMLWFAFLISKHANIVHEGCADALECMYVNHPTKVGAHVEELELLTHEWNQRLDNMKSEHEKREIERKKFPEEHPGLLEKIFNSIRYATAHIDPRNSYLWKRKKTSNEIESQNKNANITANNV